MIANSSKTISIKAISAEAWWEKSVRKEHISLLHLFYQSR
jgi:hypothetical protein